MNENDLLEPLKYYNDHLKQSFLKHAEDIFQEQTQESGINVEENRRSVKELSDLEAQRDGIGKKLSVLKGWRTFCIVLSVIGFVAGLVGFILYFKDGASSENSFAFLLVGIIGLIIGVAALLPIFLLLNKKIKNLKPIYDDLVARANKKLAECYEQMAPMNALFDWNMPQQAINRASDIIDMDEYFTMEQFLKLKRRYGFQEDNDENISTLQVFSGTILENPFVVKKSLVHKLGQKTYTGSLTIHWTTTEFDKDGHPHTQHHSQVLVASVLRDAPFYSTTTELIYGNDAAPDLSFTRNPSGTKGKDEKQIEKKVRSKEKKLERKEAKALKKGSSNFTKMSDTQFDALFGALDRDHEVQFRLLFTPLAQKNEIALIKNQKPFGDDFSFAKRKCLNYIASQHSQNIDYSADPKTYISHSYDLSKEKYMSYLSTFFEGLFFDLAPLLAIPLYQQTKSKEDIYETELSKNYTSFECEVLVNKLNKCYDDLVPSGADTNVAMPIFKTGLYHTDGKSDEVKVTAHTYHAENRTEFVPTLGGDGRIHAVPVPWIEYTPITKESFVEVRHSDLSKNQFEKSKNGELSSFLNKFAHRGSYVFERGFFAMPVTKNFTSRDDDELEKIINKTKEI